MVRDRIEQVSVIGGDDFRRVDLHGSIFVLQPSHTTVVIKTPLAFTVTVRQVTPQWRYR